MAISDIQNMSRTVQSNLAIALQDSNEDLVTHAITNAAAAQSSPFDREEMMDELMNQIGLKVQRDGG